MNSLALPDTKRVGRGYVEIESQSSRDCACESCELCLVLVCGMISRFAFIQQFDWYIACVARVNTATRLVESWRETVPCYFRLAARSDISIESKFDEVPRSRSSCLAQARPAACSSHTV